MTAKHDNLKPDPLAQTHEVFNQARAVKRCAATEPGGQKTACLPTEPKPAARK
jgi:hypothetical protein